MVVVEIVGLVVMVVVGGDVGVGIDEVLFVVLFGVGVVQVELFLVVDFEEYVLVYQVFVVWYFGGFFGEQFVVFGEGGERGVLVW